jgi:hypothetical protein
MPGMTLHSLRSSPLGPRPAPLGQSFSNSARKKVEQNRITLNCHYRGK